MAAMHSSAKDAARNSAALRYVLWAAGDVAAL